MKKTYFQKLISVWLAFIKLGFISFGGPVAHIGYFREEFVLKRAWFSESQFAQLAAISQFLPGPASSQVGFAIGLLRAGWLGALVAFISFTLPSVALMIMAALFLPDLNSEISLILVAGLKLIACIVVLDAVIGMCKQFCRSVSKVNCCAQLQWLGF